MKNINRYTFNLVLSQSVLYLVLLGLALIVAAPILWALITSLKPNVELFALPLKIFPSRLTLEHYPKAIRYARLGQVYFNTFIVSVGIVISQIVFCSMAGYAFARLPFPAKNVIFVILLATMMIPLEAAVVPIFLFVRGIPLAGGNNIMGQGGKGLIDSYLGLILPTAMSIYGMFLFRQFFSTLPKDLEEAGRIDGSSEWGVFWRIVLPQSGAIIATITILSFLWGWNQFMWPLLITQTESMKTVQLSLSAFHEASGNLDWGPLLAASLLICIPPLVVFIIFQRYFVKGFATSGIKG